MQTQEILDALRPFAEAGRRLPKDMHGSKLVFWFPDSSPGTTVQHFRDAVAVYDELKANHEANMREIKPGPGRKLSTYNTPPAAREVTAHNPALSAPYDGIAEKSRINPAGWDDTKAREGPTVEDDRA